MKSDKQTKSFFKRTQVTCPLFCFIILVCAGLSSCGILIPSITSDKVDMVELNNSDFVKVIIDDADLKGDETGRQLIENIHELFSKKFKHTTIESNYQDRADDCLYINPESVSKVVLGKSPDNTTKVESRVRVKYGQRSELIAFEGSGRYAAALPEAAVGTFLGIFTLGISIKGQLALYESVAQSQACEAISSKIFNRVVSDPIFTHFVSNVKMARSLPSDLSVTVKFSDTSGLFPNNIMDAAEEGEMVVAIINKGKGAGYGTVLEIATDASRIAFDKSITIGDIPPGETKEVRVKLKAGHDLADGETPFAFTLKEKRGYDARKVIYPLRTARLLKPQLQIVDKQINDGDTGLAKGNGNGIPESGETVEVIAFIKNSGEGRAIGVTLKGSELSTGVRWVKDEILVGAILAGETVKAKLAFEIPRNYDGREIASALSIADVRGVGNGSGRLNLAYGRKTPELQYVWKVVTTRGDEVSSITNGGEYELELSLANRGGMAARNVTLTLSPGSGVNLAATRIDAGEVKEQASMPARRVRLSLPRTYNESRALVSLSIDQSDFPAATGAISIPVEVKAPRLTYTAQMHSKRGGNALEQGETAMLELRVINDGSLPAQGVRVNIASRDENLRIMSKAVEMLGTVKPATAGETIKFQLTATRRITPGENRLAVEISQDDFPAVAIPYALAIREEGADVIRVAAADTDSSRIRQVAKSSGGPEITIKGDEPETAEETYRLAFEVADATRNIDDIKVSVNGVVIPLGTDSGLGTNPQKRKQIMAAILLRDGVNHVLITARNTDYASSSRELVITRRAEEDVDTPIVTGMNNPNGVAVVIGVSKYENPNIPAVDYARRDAMKIREYLINTMGYKKGNILELYDEKATVSKIKNTLNRELKSRVTPNSDVFVYFSGHGLPETNANEPYLTTYDVVPENPGDTAYSMKDFYGQLESLKARNVTVVIDACFSGMTDSDSKRIIPLIRSASPVFMEVSNPMLKIRNGVVFTSSKGKQISSWYHKKQHGLFTYYFLQGLRGKADFDGSGVITAKGMERYLTQHVPNEAMKLYSREQTPEVMGNKEMILVKLR